MNIVEEVKKLGFPIGKYVVIGGGTLEALGIRETNDVDISVTPDFFEELQKTGLWKETKCWGAPFLKQGNVDINARLNWDAYPTTTEEAIESAIMIGGVPFMNIHELRKFKVAFGREKDMLDVRLIDEYLKSYD